MSAAEATITDDPDTTDSEGGHRDVAPAPKPLSPLDQAMRASRPRHAAQESLWLGGDEAALLPHTAFDPRNVTSSALYSDELGSTVQGAVNALEALHDAVAQVIAVRTASRADPSLNEPQAILLTASSYDKLVPVATKKLDAARAHLEAVVTQADAELAAPIRTGGQTPQAAELRLVLRGMTQAERTAALTKAVADGDAALAGAALGSHPLLSGIDAAMQASLTQQWNKLRNPALVQRRELAQHALKSLEAAGAALLRDIDRIQGAKSHVVERLRGAQRKARTVVGAFVPQV